MAIQFVRGYTYTASRGRSGSRRSRGAHRGAEASAETRPELSARFDPPSAAGQYTADLEAKFGAVIEGIYRDPAAARRRFEELAGRMGWGAALAELRHSPDSFGRLRGGEVFGLIRRNGVRDRAYHVLPIAVQLARVYLASRRALAPPPAFVPAAALAAPQAETASEAELLASAA